MPNSNSMIVGERAHVHVGTGYKTDSMYNMAQSYMDLHEAVMEETNGLSLAEATRVLNDARGRDTLKNWFIRESYDPNLFQSAEEAVAFEESMGELFENDVEAIESINEFAPVSAYNPVVGLTFPMHKNLLMNNVYENVIPRKVAVSPKFDITMEYRYLVKPDGTKIDIFKNQSMIADAIDACFPWTTVTLTLPENGTTNVWQQIGGTSAQYDHISIETYISKFYVHITLAVGDVNPITGTAVTQQTVIDYPVKCRINFSSGDHVAQQGYDHEAFQRHFMTALKGDDIVIKNSEGTTTQTIKYAGEIINGIMHENKFYISANKGSSSVISKVDLTSRLDTSNAMENTVTPKWEPRETEVEIGEAPYINVVFSPQELKDISTMFNVNQVTKTMGMIKIFQSEYRDKHIKTFLDESYTEIDDTLKASMEFDFKPRTGYADTHVQWIRDTFMWRFNSLITKLMRVYNDPNMTISVVGDSDILEKLGPKTEYSYTTPPTIGPVELDYAINCYSSNKRFFQFVSSDKKRDDLELNVYLKPRNTERLTYCLFDYQTYVSNEIRNISNPALPAVHSFDRFRLYSYQPVQGKVTILNRYGL